MRDAYSILIEWYTGELGGRELFLELAKRSQEAYQTKWQRLAQTEEYVAANIVTVLKSRNIPVPAPTNLIDRAVARVQAVAGRPWHEQMQWLETIAAAALEHMRSDATQLPIDLYFTGRLMISHEIALLAFAHRELSGDGANSLEPIEQFLQSSRDSAGPSHGVGSTAH